MSHDPHSPHWHQHAAQIAGQPITTTIQPTTDYPCRNWMYRFLISDLSKGIYASGPKKPGDWSWGTSWELDGCISGSFKFTILYVSAYGQGYRVRMDYNAYMWGKDQFFGPQITFGYHRGTYYWKIPENVFKEFTGFSKDGKAWPLNVSWSATDEVAAPWSAAVEYVQYNWSEGFWKLAPTPNYQIPTVGVEISMMRIWPFWHDFILYMSNSYFHELNKVYGDWVPIQAAFDSYRRYVLDMLRKNVGISHPEVQKTIIAEAQKYLDWGVVLGSELTSMGFIVGDGKVVGTTNVWGRPTTTTGSR